MKRLGFIDARRIRGFTLSGSTALTGMNLAITDISTPSSGYCRGLYINYTSTGAKTGSAELNPLAIDMNATANVPHAFNISLYTGGMAGATINHLAGIYLYMDACTGTIGAKHGLWLQMVGTGATTADFLTLHHMGGTIRALICTRSVGVTSTNFLHMFGAQLPFVAGGCDVSGASGSEPYLRVVVVSTVYGIPLIAI